MPGQYNSGDCRRFRFHALQLLVRHSPGAADAFPARRQCAKREAEFEILGAMSPARKRTVRLVVALSAAVLLASALIYTSFSAASPALTPEPARPRGPAGPQLPGDRHGRRRLGPQGRRSAALQRRRTAPGGRRSRSSYTGTVPDPFREGREVIVTVQKQGSAYVGERNSLITKCPSKYKTAPAEREAELLSAARR